MNIIVRSFDVKAQIKLFPFKNIFNIIGFFKINMAIVINIAETIGRWFLLEKEKGEISTKKYISSMYLFNYY